MATTNMSFDELCLAIESHQNELDGYLKDYGKVVEINKRIEYADMGNKQQVNSLMIALESITGIDRDTFYYDAGYGLESEESQGNYKDDFKRLGGVLVEAGKHLFRLILKLLDAVLIILKMLVRALYSLLNKFVGFEEEFNKRSSSLADSAREEVIRKAEEFKVKEAEAHQNDEKQTQQNTTAANDEEVSSTEDIQAKSVGGFFSFGAMDVTFTDVDYDMVIRYGTQTKTSRFGSGTETIHPRTLSSIEELISVISRNILESLNYTFEQSTDFINRELIGHSVSMSNELNNLAKTVQSNPGEASSRAKEIVRDHQHRISEFYSASEYPMISPDDKDNLYFFYQYQSYYVKAKTNDLTIDLGDKVKFPLFETIDVKPLKRPEYSGNYITIKARKGNKVSIDNIVNNLNNVTNALKADHGKKKSEVEGTFKTLIQSLNGNIKLIEQMKREVNKQPPETAKATKGVVELLNAASRQILADIKFANIVEGIREKEIEQSVIISEWLIKNVDKMLIPS